MFALTFFWRMCYEAIPNWFAIVTLALVFLFASDGLAQSGDRQKLEKEIDSLIEQLKEKAKEFLEPSAEERQAFAEFLSQPDAGIIRLLPREKYNTKMPLRGGGAYYSFTRLTHEYGYGSDISLEQNHFSVAFAGADFGFIVKLGDVPLENVSLEHPGVKYLAAFTTPLKEPEAREQYRRGYPGFETEGFAYARRLPAYVNATYAVRSINYRESDVLVAFRVVRQDADGSMTILWKLLNKFPAPHLVHE